MIELVFLYVYGGRLLDALEDKGQPERWAAVGIGAFLLGEIVGIWTGLALGAGGWWAWAIGIALGLLLAPLGWLLVRSLPVSPRRQAYLAGIPLEQTCPQCTSLQTAIYGHRLRCYACDYLGPLRAAR